MSLRELGKNFEFVYFEEAVRKALNCANGDIVLLSPACASGICLKL
ncbi:hypothetical protein [Caldicellulosiruptor bescii]|nr:hypothetical protein [Caldicellulosiruptor bescii]